MQLFRQKKAEDSMSAKAVAPDLGVDLTDALENLMGGDGGSGGGSSGGGSGGGSSKDETPAAPPEPKYTNEELLADYFALFYDNYKPEKLTYDLRGADDIAREIGAWLRPAYEAAIAARQKQTDSYRAELDADAIARGMGASSYVTDVKSRQMQNEAGDILSLETDYAAQLANKMAAAMEVERERAYETDRFNAEAEQEAYEKAYDLAVRMLEAYRAGDRAAKQFTRAMYANRKD